MESSRAIALLRRMQEPEAYEPQITEEACEALELASKALGTDTNVGTTDAISRQAAIDGLAEYGNGRAVYISVKEAVRRIEQLPPIQPEPYKGVNV